MARLTLAKRSTILGAALLAIIITLFMGRIIGFPVAIVIVSGRSMKPTLLVGDVVIGVKASFKVGDIVVWCVSPTYCVIHRVIKISGKYVTTKGDNNPMPDPPVPASFVKYKVIYVIPRRVWVPIVAIGILIYVYKNRKLLRSENIAPGDIAVLIVVSFIVFNSAIALLAPTYYSPNPGSLVQPRVSLKGTHITKNGSVLITFTMYNTYLIHVSKCQATIFKENKSVVCRAKVISPTQVLVRDFPRSFLKRMYEEGAGPLLIHIKAKILFGSIDGTYYIYPGWRKIIVNVSAGIVRIYNPNPVSVNVNVTLLVSNTSGRPKIIVRSYSLPPYGGVEVDLSMNKYAVVRIKYLFEGKVILIQKRVMP